MIVENFKQCSPEWFAARVGIPTASNFGKILTATGKTSDQRSKYMAQLVRERLSGTKENGYQSDSMTRGIEMEQEAIRAYSFITDCNPDSVGLVYKDELKLFSCSPDGLVDDCGIEIKCPSLHVHIEYYFKNRVPPKYFPQVQGCMFVTGLKQWDFMSYYPGTKPLIVRMEANEKWQSLLADALECFCEELDEIMA